MNIPTYLLPVDHKPWSKKKWISVLAVALGLWLVYAWVAPGKDFYGAYTWMVLQPERYPSVADYPWTLNPPWMVPFMAPFITLPGRAGYILFAGFTIAMIILGTYVFGGRPILTLLSAQMWWVLWWGQLEGWGVLALVLGWIALKNRAWLTMFLALAIGAFKPQVGLIPVLGLWWWSGRRRWIPAAALAVIAGLTLLIWGPWPLWYWQGIHKFVGDQHFNPWNSSIGYAALPLFLPALLIPLSREKRLAALTATTLLASPYLPYYSTILLLCFDLPLWAYIFAFTSYLPNVIGTALAWNAVALLPASVLVWIYWPFLKGLIARWRARNAPPAE